MKGKLLNVILIMALALSLSSAAFAQTGGIPDRPLPESVEGLKLESPVEVSDALSLLKVDQTLLKAKGPQQVVVRLDASAVAEVAAAGKGKGQQQSQLAKVNQQQKKLENQAKRLDAETKVLGQAQKALNAVMLEIDADSLADLAASPDVVSIHPVVDYELALSETVPYIGATAVHDLGVTGEGVRVAVLDTGVDYTHANMGGPGTDGAFHQAYGENFRSGHNRKITNRYLGELLFPTSKVVGGFDFVGEFWVGGADTPPLQPDPNPIDLGGHGTHVADIIGGMNGVAPGVEIYAVKVCATFSTACSGVALIQAMDFALDPDGDGDLSDHVDLINMSLGALYGQAFDDDLSLAVDNATAVGVLTVAASGNSADKPYVTSTPGAARTALSVAQTQVPSAVLPLMQIVSPEGHDPIAAVFQPWSVPLSETGPIEAPLQYGDGAGGNLNGCSEFPAGSLAGLVVLVDRGDCNFTLKIRNIGLGGGLAGVIGLVAPGEPFSGGDGGDRPIDIPGFMISQDDSNLLKGLLGEGQVIVRFDPEFGLELVGQMVGSSSRGPTMLTNWIKPEIGAPGASVSAVAGTGTGTGPFGGTSGATPMITGSAALLLSANPDRSPAEIKAVLMNTAETEILNEPPELGGDLAPITRIGGGEVRVDRAFASPAAAWDADFPSAALSFAFHDVTEATTELVKTVTVWNYSGSHITYDISPTFRFPDDGSNGAVTVSTPASVSVPAGGNANFDVTLTIDGAALRNWNLNSGSQGANGDRLTTLEYDGYIFLDDPATETTDDLHLPWQILPRQAGNVSVEDETVAPNGTTTLHNNGIGAAPVESYSLIGTSDDMPEGGRGEQNPNPDLRFVGYATFPVPAGFCSGVPSFVMAFAVNTWERQTHANAPTSFEFSLDVDQDGNADYLVLNRDVTFSSLTDGRNLSWVINLATNSASAFFFTDHQTNNGNTVLQFCGEQVGMNAENFQDPFDMTAGVRDIYFTGAITDQIAGITISPLGEQYLGVFDGTDVGFTVIPSMESVELQVLDGGQTTNNTETGLLLLYRNGAPVDNEAATVLVEP